MKKWDTMVRKNISYRFEGSEGVGIMQGIMKSMRDDIPADVGGEKVIRVRDYQTFRCHRYDYWRKDGT